VKRIRTNIYRRYARDGRAFWMVRWWDEFAMKWRALKGGDTKDEALLAEAELKQDLLKGINPRASLRRESSETVAELIDLFLKSPRFQTASPEWQEEMRFQLDGYIREELGRLRFADLTRERLYNFYLSIKGKYDLSNSTIQKYHFKLCFLGDLYVELHPDRRNTVRELKDFSKRFPPQAPTREINFLDAEEIEEILKELENSPSELAHSYVKFLANTGMRRNEALGLKWTDIDEKAGFIHIRKSKNGKARTIPLETDALEAVVALNRATTYVFTWSNGGRPYQDVFIKPFQRAARRAGIKKRVDLHSLRHSYGSNKLRAGWGLKKISMILGHADVSLTARIYTHLLDGDLKVRDDFRFDKSEPPQNSGKESGTFDPQTLMATIQLLQNQLAAMTIQAGQTATAPSAPNLAEESRKIPNLLGTTGSKLAVCYPNATRLAEKTAEAVSDQGKINEFSIGLARLENGAGEGARTLDLKLGKLAL